MSAACLVCNALNLEMISIFRHTKKLDDKLNALLALQAQQDDYLCKDCCDEIITVYNSIQKRKECNLSATEVQNKELVLDSEISPDDKDKFILLNDSEIKLEEEDLEDLVVECDNQEISQLCTDENVENRPEGQKDVKASSITERIKKCDSIYILLDNGDQDSNKKTTCPICEKNYGFATWLKKHIETIHKLKASFIRISDNLKTIKQNENLQTGKPSQKLYICSYCSGISKKINFGYFESDKTGPLNCAECGKECSTYLTV